MSAVTWPASIFELDAGIGLAVCVAHRGAHIHYQGGCVGFARERMPTTLRVRLTAQDRPPDPEPVEVRLDEERLAAGIALALDQLMQRRREQRGPGPAPEPPKAMPPEPRGNSILDRYET